MSATSRAVDRTVPRIGPTGTAATPGSAPDLAVPCAPWIAPVGVLKAAHRSGPRLECAARGVTRPRRGRGGGREASDSLRSMTETEPRGPSLQERFAPKNSCFGCGPANPKGLRIRSFAEGEDVVAEWSPEPHHEAFPGMLNGGIIGALLDCHSNWTAAWHLMGRAGAATPPCTVTASYTVKCLRPTPTSDAVLLRARVVDAKEDRATVEATLTAGGKVCATCSGLFVAVQPGHPAYHRW